MSATSARLTAKLIRTMGLMASASVMSIIMAGEAQANCVVTLPAGASLNNLPTDADVDCTGVTTGQTIIANGISADIDVAAGASFDNGTIAINGPDTRVYFGTFGGAATTVQDLALATSLGMAQTNVRFFNADVTDLDVQIDGQASTLRFLDGTSVTTTPGNILLTGATNNPGPGGNGILSLEGNSSISAIGAGNGSYLLTTGSGNESVFLIDSSLTAASDGLLLSTGAGSDAINIWGNSTLAGGSGTLSIDGGTEFDRIRWRGGSAAIIHDVDVTNVEEAVFESLSATAPLVMRGTADYATVYIGGVGTTRFDDIAALGANNAAVQVVSGATLELNANTATTFNHVFTGTGTILQTEGVNTYNGNSAAFAGTLVIDFNRAILGNSNAMGTADIVNNSLLFFGDFVLANDISGTGQVVQTGPGVGTLSGNNSFTGDLGILAGGVKLTNVTAGGANNTIRGLNPGTFSLELAIATDGTISNNIGSGIALTKTGAGVVTLTGTNTYAGGTTIAGGALRVDDFARLGTGAVVANAGTSLILNYNGAGQLLQTTPFMTGAGSFIKEGTGDVVLSQAGTYTGGTTIRAGRIGLNNGNALGTGAIQIDAGATLGLGNVTLLNTITGAGSIVKTASGTAELGADNSGFTGTFDIQDGDVYVTDGRSLGSGSVIVGSGTQLRVDSNPGDTTVAANLSGDGDLYKFGANRLTLTGTNTLSHNVFVSNGTLQIEGSQNIGTANVELTNAGSVLHLATNGSTTFGNNLSGLGSVIKTGTGTVFLTGSNNYAGGTDIQQGAIRVADVSFLGTGAITVQQGAALDLAIAGQQSLNQAISGAGLLRKSDTGDLTLLGNGLTGGLDVVGGRVIVNTAGAIGGGPVSLAADTQLVFDNATTETMSTAISGAGALTKDGAGVLVIQNANTYTGGTIINAGRLGLNNGQGLGSGPVIVLQGAQLSIGGITLANTISGAGQVVKTSSNVGSLTGINSHNGGTDIQGGTLLVNSTAALGNGAVTMAAGTFLDIDYTGISNVALNNVVSGGGTLVKDGTGTVIVTGANSYTGGTAINAGRLGINTGSALGTGGVTVNSGAELALGDVSLANAVTGTGMVIKTSAGNTELTGANTFSGGLQLQGGNLTAASVGSLGTGGIAFAGGSSLSVGNAANQTLALPLTGAGSLVKVGTGDLTVTGNALTGGLTISAGRVLATGGTSATGSGAIAIGSGAELVFTAASNSTFANGLSGAGTFRKLGAGQLLFSNPFSMGNLAVDAGSVRLNATLTGNATVASTGRLDGTGRVIGNLTNNGTVAPGNSIGTLTVQGNYVHNAGSVLEIEFDANGGIDLLAVTGTATLNGGTLRFISLGGTEGNGGTFLTATGGVTGTFATVETVGAQLPLAVIYQPTSAIMAPSVLTARASTFNAQTLAGADTTLGFIDSMGLTDLRHGSGNRLWLSGLGAWGSRSATAATLAYDHDVAGLAGGVNLAMGDNVTVGAAIGWASGDITLGSNGGGGEQSTVLGALTVRYASSVNANALSLGAGVVIGRIDQDTLRNVSFNGFAASVEGTTQSDVLAAFAEAAVPLAEQDRWTFAAKGRAAFVHLSQDGYTESGSSPLRLQLDDLGTSTMEAEGLLSANLNLIDGGFAAEDSPESLDLRFDLGARFLAALGDRAIPVSFAASNAGVVLQGDTRDVVQGVGGLSLGYTTRENLTMDAGYRAEIGQRDNHTVQARVSLAF